MVTFLNFNAKKNLKQKTFFLLYSCKSAVLDVINKGYFSEAFLFKPRGGRSPPSGLNRKPRKNPLFSLNMAQINTCY